MPSFNTIVIGGNLNAALYAYINNHPIIINEATPPNKFESFPVGYDLKTLPFFPSLDSFDLTDGSTRHVGNEKFEVWGRLLYSMSLAGLVPFHNGNTKILIDKTDLEVTMYDKSTTYATFKKVIIFDDQNVIGLNPSKSENKEKRQVLDWFDIERKVARQLIDFDVVPFVGSDHTKEAYLYWSPRASNHRHFNRAKDAVVLSYLTPEEIELDTPSPIVVRLHLEDELKKIIDQKKIDLKHTHRSVEYKMDFYKDTKTIKFNYQTIDEIIKSAKDNGSYCHAIAKHFKKYEMELNEVYSVR